MAILKLHDMSHVVRVVVNMFWFSKGILWMIVVQNHVTLGLPWNDTRKKRYMFWIQENILTWEKMLNATEDAYSSGHLVLSHLGLAFVLMLRPFFPELVMSTDLLSFEHPSVLLFCLSTGLTKYSAWNLETHGKALNWHVPARDSNLQWYSLAANQMNTTQYTN